MSSLRRATTSAFPGFSLSCSTSSRPADRAVLRFFSCPPLDPLFVVLHGPAFLSRQCFLYGFGRRQFDDFLTIFFFFSSELSSPPSFLLFLPTLLSTSVVVFDAMSCLRFKSGGPSIFSQNPQFSVCVPAAGRATINVH